MMMLDCNQAVIFLAKINIAYTSSLFFAQAIKTQTNILTPPSITLLTLAFIATNIRCFFFDTYRLLYIDFAVIVAYLVMLHFKNKRDALELLCIITFPAAITALHVMAVSCLCLSEYIWHLWYATFILLAIWFLAKNHLNTLKRFSPRIILLLLFAFTLLLIQVPAKDMHALYPFRIFSYTINYIGSVNTFNIAIFASLALIITTYYLLKASKILKIALIITGLILAHYVLITSWRPVWLGLIIGAIFSLILVEKHKRLLLILAMLFLQIALFATNIENYGDRFIELAHNFSTDERSLIWTDTWQMQKASSPINWLYGHGLNNFTVDFRPYSTYLAKYHAHFTSPHNIFLDVLYSSGVLGLLLVLAVCYFPYRYLIKTTHDVKADRILACFILIALTATLISNGLNYAFFRLINIIPVAFIYGALIFMHENKIQTYTKDQYTQ